MSIQKSNTVQAIWVAMGSLSAFALSIISAAILSRYFNKAEYGTYRQIIYVYNTLLVVFSAGLPRVFAYYLPRYTLAQGKDIVNKITKVLLVTGLLFSIFLFFGAEFIGKILKNPDLVIGIKYFSPVPLFLLPTLGMDGIFSTYKKTLYLAIYKTTSKIIMLLFIVLPVIMFHGDYMYAIYGWIIASFLSFLVALYFKNIPFKNVKAKKSSLDINEIFKYSLPLLIASLGGIAMKAADQFYISRYFGQEIFAVFANGFMELPFVSMITFSIASILMPVFSKIDHEKNDIKEIQTIWQSALMKSAMIIYPLVLFFIFYADEVMVILFSSKYIQSATYFRIALIFNFFNVIMFAPLLLSLGKTKLYSNLHIIFALITWLGGYIIVHLSNSPFYIAIFSIVKSILLTLTSFYYTSKLIKISFLKLFPIDKLFILIIHGSLSLIVVKYTIQKILPNSKNIFILGILFASFGLILLASSKLFKLDYLKFIKPIYNSIKNKIKK